MRFGLLLGAVEVVGLVRLGHDVADVVPRVPVEALLQPLLVQVVACSADIGTVRGQLTAS